MHLIYYNLSCILNIFQTVRSRYKCGKEFSGCLMYRTISSANRDILCPSLSICTPFMLVLSHTHVANISITAANNELDSGHSCLIPLIKGKWSDALPLVITAALGV